MLGFLKSTKAPKAKGLESVLGDYELPSFPATAMKVMDDLRDPTIELGAIAESIASNPGLTVKVLRLVNSAAFGASHPVEKLDHAVRMLGRARLETTVLSVVVREALPTPNSQVFDSPRFWATSFRRAALARQLADLLHPAEATECFAMGLLQDMAVPLLATSRQSEYEPVLDHWLNDPKARTDLASLERESLAFDHAEVGGLIGRHWGMPEALISAISGHHADDEAAAPPAIRLVAWLREGADQEGLDPLIHEAHCEYELAEDLVVSCAATAFRQAEDLARAF